MRRIEAPIVEVEALAFARQEIARWHSGTSPWANAPVMSETASRAFMRENMGMAARFSTYTRMRVIAAARFGDEDARAVLRDLILEMRALRQETAV